MLGGVDYTLAQLMGNSCNMHVSCNMRGFGTFNKHATCMLQACNMHGNMHITCLENKDVW